MEFRNIPMESIWQSLIQSCPGAHGIEPVPFTGAALRRPQSVTQQRGHHLVPAEWVTTQALSDVICLSESLFPFEPSSRQLESVLSATLKFYPHIADRHREGSHTPIAFK